MCLFLEQCIMQGPWRFVQRCAHVRLQDMCLWYSPEGVCPMRCRLCASASVTCCQRRRKLTAWKTWRSRCSSRGWYIDASLLRSGVSSSHFVGHNLPQCVNE